MDKNIKKYDCVLWCDSGRQCQIQNKYINQLSSEQWVSRENMGPVDLSFGFYFCSELHGAAVYATTSYLLFIFVSNNISVGLHISLITSKLCIFYTGDCKLSFHSTTVPCILTVLDPEDWRMGANTLCDTPARHLLDHQTVFQSTWGSLSDQTRPDEDPSRSPCGYKHCLMV